MKSKLLLILVLGFLAVRAQDGFIEKFPVHDNGYNLNRIAQPSQYFDKIGRKTAVMGSEAGSFELWIWPWKPLRNFDLQFFTENSTTPILSKDIVKEITVLPEATIITYAYENFSVKEIIFVPVDETAVVILLDVNTVIPLSIVPGFIPVMQPQWPAGIGGQYSYWDDNMKAYVISESQQRGLFLCGSPLGRKMTEPPAHMFADNPLQFRIDLSKEDAGKGFVPIIISGIPVKSRYDSVKTSYQKILKSIPDLYQKNKDYYSKLQEETISLHTPVSKLNSAYFWGKIGLRNLLVENPALGKGLVAGYGLSGTGGRPGFAWFFGGDAYINSLAMNSYQDYSTVKDALLFTQKWQRQENYPIRKKNPEQKNIDVGKMAHELSQSEGLIDWWNDYHFGYNHADTSPWYIVAIGDYYRNTGDSVFIKESWTSIKQAYKWSLSKDSNNDGLMDLKGAGLGVLEFGSLVNIHNDIYTQALWTQCLKEMITMAEMTGDSDILKEAKGLLEKATNSLEKIYWMQDPAFYSFGANQDGEQVKEKSIYSSSALYFNLLDKERSISTLKKFNTSELITSWGVRNLSNKSGFYNPSNYNYGTVWPFTSFMIGTAEFNYNFCIQGYQILSNTINNIFNYGLGTAPEVLSGDFNNKLAESYHNQGFSYSGFILPMVKGLLGLETDALNNQLELNPKFPADWDSVQVGNIKLNTNNISFDYQKTRGKLIYNFSVKGEGTVSLEFNPILPPGNLIKSLFVNGEEYSFNSSQSKYYSGLEATISLANKTEIVISYQPVPEIFLIPSNEPIGSINKILVINSQEYYDGMLQVNTEIFPGETYKLGITNFDLISKVTGAELQDNLLVISSDPGNGTHIPKEIVIEFRK